MNLSRQTEYVLDLLKRVYPFSRTIKEIEWWFVTMDKVGSKNDLKDALRELKIKGMVRYRDPVGWGALDECEDKTSEESN